MNDLPKGWAVVALGDLLQDLRNGIFVSRPGIEDSGRPILRISAVRPMTLRVEDVRYVAQSATLTRQEGYYLGQGDLLFTRYSGNVNYVGACARVRHAPPNLLYPDKLIRGRTIAGLVEPAYLEAVINSPQARAAIRRLVKTTAGQIGISGSDLRSIPIPLAPYREQLRISATVDEQFSQLDAGIAALERASQRIVSLVKSIILAAIPEVWPEHWKRTSIGEAGEVMLGRQRSPRYHNGPNMRRYLRVANVFEDRIDAEDVMAMHFDDNEYARYVLQPGDIMLNEGQSPHLLGRPAMYSGEPSDVAFTNSLIRFRAGPEVLAPWALLVFRRHLHGRRFMRESKITTNIAHLSVGRFKSVEFPVPPLGEQKMIVAQTEARLAEAAHMAALLNKQRVRAAALRSSILAAAYSGRLAPQGSSDEPASELIRRIGAERASVTGRMPAPREPREQNTT